MTILRPGCEPPLIVPYCQLCDMPVESFCMDVVTSPYRAGIHASCCGKTSSAYLPIEEIFRLRRTNEKFFVITRKGSFQRVAAR